uniref:Purinergic receptor n=1 Tax=Clytia hemisphaerica TaxID=252671 RepID=A0A7M5WXX6_9CNID
MNQSRKQMVLEKSKFHCINFLLSYETGKVVEIQNKKVAFWYRLIQLSVIIYVIGYAIIYDKGYQEIDSAISSTNTKVKGITHVNFGNFPSTFFNGRMIYDPQDYVIKQDGDSFFVMTNMVITPKQYQGKCPEDPESYRTICKTDKDCQQGTSNKYGHGERSGRCVPSDRNSTVKVCESYGWCPTEYDVLPMENYNNFSKTIPLLDGTKESTVLIKNQIHFPKFKVTRNNIVHNQKKGSYMKRCLHNEETDPFCPIFKLRNIVENCGDNYTKVGFKGGIYGIIIKWDCNLDHSIYDCVPEYKFERLDDEKTPLSHGYNFRYVNYFVENGTRYRTLTKAYGIKFELVVFGKAGKFDIIPLLMNLGAGIGLLGIATIWCDFIVLNLVEKKEVYREHILESVEEQALRRETLRRAREQSIQNEFANNEFTNNEFAEL